MNRNWLVGTLTLGAVALLSGAAAPGPTFQFTSINFPGAVFTIAEDIGPGGQIVGFYTDTGGKQHGFLLSGGNFSSIDYPGAIYTDGREISPGGDIVGAFMNTPGGPPNMHGYLLRQGTFSEIQVPGTWARSPSGSRLAAIFTPVVTTMISGQICADSYAMPLATTRCLTSSPLCTTAQRRTEIS